MNSLKAHTLGGGQITQAGGVWQLCLPAGDARTYRLAQLDDYSSLPRPAFPWPVGVCLRLRARASHPQIPGTWGFGFWNDPFSLSLGLGGGVRRFPALPNAAWFFFASPQNYLSFRDDQPGSGALASAFTAPRVPAPFLGAAAPLLSASLWPPAGRALRRLAARFIRQANHPLRLDITQWHTYTLHWRADQVTWQVDGQEVFRTACTPRPPLGLVLWIDNQYAAWGNDGRVAWGLLPAKQDYRVEIADFACDLLDNNGAIV
ncbi:MAG: hypothetical protein Fur0018_05500 [Anaerolineales bacterium]